ncbi:hypothetical protein ABFS82_10G090600 [Erythranthe guttata]|uniref:uncharacterized protein LOC105966314 n=1 Tax=Erythranthe guttata TaxID=4155 RepID=UPI00064D8800|nr:PREDICTED: uncharacterized protein LOC105966314 [Erythranthe guttata]|eukprot:XP_012846333.1 PREDICTED: uncharacterized protein LOC105966314 [Erythranthe guttata]
MASFILLRRLIYPAAVRSCCNWISPAGICSGARRISSSSSAAAPPWLMIDGSKKDSYKFYNLADKQVVSVGKKREEEDGVLVGSSHGWLAFYKENMNPGPPIFDLFLSNPLSNHEQSLVKLPPVETLPLTEDKLRRGWGTPTKIILSSSPDNNREACRAIMSFGPELRLAFCCPGRSDDEEWTPIGSLYHKDDPIDRRIARGYVDFVYSTRRNRLLCATTWGHFESWDLVDPHSPKMNWDKVDREMDCDKVYEVAEKEPIDLWKYIVFAERSNRIFLVRRYAVIHIRPDGSSVEEYDDSFPYKTVDFDVHELVVEKEGERDQLRYMDGTLDGMAFFIGTGHGFVIEGDDELVKHNVEPDSIYFTDMDALCPTPWNRDITTYGGHDLGIFNYRDKKFYPCYYPCDIQSIQRIDPPPLWFTPSSST